MEGEAAGIVGERKGEESAVIVVWEETELGDSEKEVIQLVVVRVKKKKKVNFVVTLFPAVFENEGEEHFGVGCLVEIREGEEADLGWLSVSSLKSRGGLVRTVSGLWEWMLADC